MDGAARRPSKRGYHPGQMTERGLPTSDGAPACPFVAFEDDRDERATSPDHRHRCYAEPNPAPRALAHQEAYCLSSAFPVCPTFQDWARREAARSRGQSVEAADSTAAAIAAQQAQRNPPRSWQAPPPWMAGNSRHADDDEIDDRWERDEDVAGPPPSREPDPHADEVAQEEIPASGRGLSGSYADRVAAGGVADDASKAEPPDHASEPLARRRGPVTRRRIGATLPPSLRHRFGRAASATPSGWPASRSPTRQARPSPSRRAAGGHAATRARRSGRQAVPWRRSRHSEPAAFRSFPCRRSSSR